jgi:hypothetical protein
VRYAAENFDGVPEEELEESDASLGLSSDEGLEKNIHPVSDQEDEDDQEDEAPGDPDYDPEECEEDEEAEQMEDEEEAARIKEEGEELEEETEDEESVIDDEEGSVYSMGKASECDNDTGYQIDVGN